MNFRVQDFVTVEQKLFLSHAMYINCKKGVFPGSKHRKDLKMELNMFCCLI